MLEIIGFSKSVGRQRMIDSSNRCSELVNEGIKEHSEHRYIIYIQISWKRNCKLDDINDKLNPNVREFELRG
jgi:hypothetical protein